MRTKRTAARVRQAGAREHRPYSFFEGLKAADGVVQSRGGVEEVVRSRSQDKGKREFTRRLSGCCYPFDSQAIIAKRSVLLRVASSIVHPTSPTSAASRIVSATTSGASPNPFSRSAETGKSVASTIMRACASASSRVSPPSLRPRAEAEAALDVANAWKPRPARMRAEPTSHGFGITKAPGPS